MDDVAAALAAENKELRARLRAFEQSEVVERRRFCRFTATSESRMAISNVRKNEFN